MADNRNTGPAKKISVEKADDAGASVHTNYISSPLGRMRSNRAWLLAAGHAVQGCQGGWRVVSPDGEVVRKFSRRRGARAISGDTPRTGAVPEPLGLASDGWQGFATWTNKTGNPITLFSACWVVPPTPATTSDQQLYLFIGLQEAGGGHILQPVLQWGARSDSPGSGQFWGVSCWWAPSQAATTRPIVQPLIKVEPGTRLVGRITGTRQADGLFTYICEFVDLSLNKLVISSVPELVECTVTLEAYAVTGDDQYPATDITAFSEITIATGGTSPDLVWMPGGRYAPTIVDDSADGGEVDIEYPTSDV